MVIVRLTKKEAEKLPLSARIPRKKDIIVEGRKLGHRWWGGRRGSSSYNSDWDDCWGWGGKFDGSSYAKKVKKGSVGEVVVGAVLWNEDLVQYIGEFFNDVFIEERRG